MIYFGLSTKKLIWHHFLTRLLYIHYWLKYYWPNRSALIETKRLKGSKKNRKAFVFGSGPSMRKLDPEKIEKKKKEGFDVLACNGYLCSAIGNKVLPTYMLFSDTVDFVSVPPDHPRASRAKLGKPDKAKAEYLGIPIFVPIKYRRFQKNQKCYFFNDFENIFSQNVSNILKPRGYGSFSGNKLLSTAVYLGYSEIYICGLDYAMFKTMTVDQDNKIYSEVQHFYDGEQRQSYKFERSDQYTVGRLMYNWHMNFIFLEKFKNQSIINLDPDSYVDAFSKWHDLDVYTEEGYSN